MQYTVRNINRLVGRIRDGKPPKPMEGKFEDVYFDPALRGFGIRVLYTGAASWFVHYQRLCRQKKVTIGDVRVLDRKAAVEAARDVLAKVQLHILDPQAAKREAMRAAKVTFESLVAIFLERKKVRPSTAKQYRQFLTGYYFQPLHKLPIDEITGSQISTQLDRISAKSGPGAALAGFGKINVFFKWAIKTGKLPEGHKNPMHYVEEPARGAARERVLSNDEIRLIWKVCEAWEIDALTKNIPGRRGPASIPDYPRAVQLLFLTGCRAQEIGGLRWSEVDLNNGEILIPKERTKNKTELCNPLPDMAVEILRKVEKERGRAKPNVFGRKADQQMGDVHIKLNARISRGGSVIKAIDPFKEQKVRDLLAAGAKIREITRETGAHQRTIRAIEARAKAGETVPEVGAAPSFPSLPHWTVHDIRRTFRTKLSECGVSRDIAEALMGHVGHLNKVERTYDRHDYWSEKRTALIKWEDKLRSIIDGTAPKIVTTRFGRKLA